MANKFDYNKCDGHNRPDCFECLNKHHKEETTELTEKLKEAQGASAFLYRFVEHIASRQQTIKEMTDIASNLMSSGLVQIGKFTAEELDRLEAEVAKLKDENQKLQVELNYATSGTSYES